MGSSYFGEPNMGNERGAAAGSSSSSSSSRKGKKSNSDKPKQPQRGLGVAQLEKIRLHGQMASSTYLPIHHHHTVPFPANFNQEDNMRLQTWSYFSYDFQYPSMMMGIGEYDQRLNMRYSDSQPSTTASWNPNSGIFESHHFVQPNMTRQLLNLKVEDSHSKKTKRHRSNSLGSSSQNSESSDTQDLDLELRLSL